jgi:hypothetical protein
MRRRAAGWYVAALAGPQVADDARDRAAKRLAAAPKPDPAVPGTRCVLLFGTAKKEGPLFEPVAGGMLRIAGEKGEAPAVLAEPNLYDGVSVVAWGANRWRDQPPADMGDAAQKALQQFVREGGDLLMFEQFAMGRMDVIKKLFGIYGSGGSSGAELVDPGLAARAAALGCTPEYLNAVHFYNSYKGLAEGSRVLVRARRNKESEDRATVVVVPHGKGRVILLGTTTDPGDQKLNQAILEAIYKLSP